MMKSAGHRETCIDLRKEQNALEYRISLYSLHFVCGNRLGLSHHTDYIVVHLF